MIANVSVIDSYICYERTAITGSSPRGHLHNQVGFTIKLFWKISEVVAYLFKGDDQDHGITPSSLIVP